MKVDKSEVIKLGDTPYTVLFLDEKRALSDWRSTVIDGTEYEFVFNSGISNNDHAVCIKGDYGFDGKTVSFT